MTETVASLLAAHRSDARQVKKTLERTFDRIREADDPAIFISRRDMDSLRAEAEEMEVSGNRELPLYGIPVAVKDNIDVAGLPTTAACPGFAYTPTEDATSVARLRKAGALVIGKTNLDQFATGIVGTRSPYGVPRNPLKRDLIPGGSSSGSAVAVARGIVPLALGTDTAGSGRVPAALNNIVGLKPSLGLVSTAGVVPACRSLDCVSIFALTTQDAFSALHVLAGKDGRDPYSRSMDIGAFRALGSRTRIGVPRAADRFFFGDRSAEAAFGEAERIAGRLGATLVDVDLAVFFETAELLYNGAWVAERTAAVGDFVARRPEDVHPVTRTIISGGFEKSAVDVFRGMYRLAELREKARTALAAVDMLMLPTVPAPCTVKDVEADPIGLNSKLGTYTNFVNLLDLSGVAVPATLAADGTPFGVTFLAPAGQDALIAGFGAAFHAATGLPLGALGVSPPPPPSFPEVAEADNVPVAVVGAHLSDMPLNGELKALGARLLGAGMTAKDYQLFLLEDGAVPRPGLLRVPAGTGAAVEVETWAVPVESLGRFVAAIPPPLSMGTVRLAGGAQVKGFLVEAEAVRNARNITSFGGWRAFLAAEGKTLVQSGQ